MLFKNRAAMPHVGAVALLESLESRQLLASAIGGTAQTFTLVPAISRAGDGSGNELGSLEPDAVEFSTGKFGRLDTTYSYDAANAPFMLRFTLFRNIGTEATPVYIKIGSPGPQSSFELEPGNYKYEAAPTIGSDEVSAEVTITLRSVTLSGAKANLSGSGRAVADGDTTPSISDFTSFGSVPPNLLNVDRTFVVRNTGEATLTLGAVTVSNGFAVKRGLPATLASGASAPFTITMSTSTIGVRSGTVTFGTNDSAVGTFSFDITGTVDPGVLLAISGRQRLRINGTAGADTIVVTQNATRIIFDVNGNRASVLKRKIGRGLSIDAFAGNDLVTLDPAITLPLLVVGNTGDDTLIGGAGKDTLLGLDGKDVLRGGGGADSLNGGNGTDTADYSERTLPVHVSLDGIDNDGAAGELDAVEETENILGGGGKDTLVGSDGANLISGLSGNDFILGMGGNDSLRGGKGNDTLRPGTGADSLTGDAGTDMADYSERAAGVTLSNDDVADDGIDGEDDQISSDIENLAGGAGGDTIALFGLGGTAFGFGGNDTIAGSRGSDTLFGGAGIDSINGYDGEDYLEGGSAADTLRGGRSNDTLLGNDGDDNLQGGYENDVLYGGSGSDLLFGGDEGFGASGDQDSLYGETGDDTFRDGFLFDGGEGTDLLDESLDPSDIHLNFP